MLVLCTTDHRCAVLQQSATHADLDNLVHALGGVILIVAQVERVLVRAFGGRGRGLFLDGGDDAGLTQQDL